MVAAVGEPGIGRQQSRQPCRIAAGNCLVNGVPDARRGKAPVKSLAQKPGDLPVAAILGHLQQGVVAVQGVAMGEVRSGSHQQPHRLKVSLAHGEVQRRHIPVAGGNQAGISLQSAAERGQVAGTGCRQHLPDVLAAPAAAAVPSAGAKLVRLDKGGRLHRAAQCGEGPAARQAATVKENSAARNYPNRMPRYLVNQNRAA